MASGNNSPILDPESLSLGVEMDENSTTNSLFRIRIFDDIEWSVDFATLLLALVVAIIWITYLTYYNARVIGFIITKVANYFHKDGRISINSLSISLLSGKIMFADFIYFHPDFTVRIQYGCIIFRYWSPYKYRRLGIDDFSHAEARISFEVAGFEIHVYNQLRRYRELNKLFDLGVFDLTNSFGDESKKRLLKECDISGTFDLDAPKTYTQEDVRKQREWSSRWLTLIPRVDINILSARISFGNRLLPSTLAVTFDNAKARYYVKTPSNSFDEYLHAIQGTCENLKVSLVKSSDFAGCYEQPPRTMGEGFVIFQTAEMEFYYYQDEVGVVRAKDDFDVVSEMPSPCWGSDLKLGKGTVISYGPWADAQRDKLYRFFFPADFQEVAIFRQPAISTRRVLTKFDLRISTLHQSTVDIWFVPDDVPHAIHMNCRQGSYCEISLPMIYEDSGYISTISGQLMMVESSTSMEYLSLFSSETLEFNICLRYPRRWSEHVVWEFFLRGCKSTVWFLYDHKTFLQNLFNEWVSSDPLDICGFAPYTYTFDCVFNDVEGVLTLNDHNWIDTSSNNEENRRAALCGKLLHVSFTIPLVEFMPDVMEMKFAFSGEQFYLKMFFPEQNILSQPLRLLHSSEQWYRVDKRPFLQHWKGAATNENGWIDCCFADKGSLTLVYYLHPMPVRPSWLTVEETSLMVNTIKQSPRSARLTSEDSLTPNTSSGFGSSILPCNQDPDLIQVDINIGPCFVQLSGALIIFILSLKENYFGETQTFVEAEKFGDEIVERNCGLVDVESDKFDARKYRPLNVKVSLVLREIEAQLLTFDTTSVPHRPIARTEKLFFEMDKRYTETKMQLCISPATLHSVSTDQEGHLLLTGFQLRGHAFFSAEGLPLDSLTSEYAWLVEIIIGDLFGRLSLKHVVQIIHFLETLYQTLDSKEEDLPLPKYADVCQHMWPRSLCPTSIKGGSLCDTEHDLKYKMTRFSMDGIHLFICECDSAFELDATTMRVAFCTEHTSSGKLGMNLALPNVLVKQFVKERIDCRDEKGNENSRWLECGKIQVVEINLNLSTPQIDLSYYEKRREFQMLHDQRSRRLAFLHRSPRHDYICGCLGGCVFFGDNRYGQYFAESFSKQATHANQKLATIGYEADPSNLSYGQSILRHQELVVVGEVTNLHSWFLIDENLGNIAARDNVIGRIKSPDCYHEAADIVHETGRQSDWKEDNDKKVERFRSFSVSTSRSSSYISTVSKNEENAMNLCHELARPIVCSPLLLASYGRFLDNYACQMYQPTISSFIDFRLTRDSISDTATHYQGTEFPRLVLRHQGLNNVKFLSSSGGGDGEDTQLMASDSVKARLQKRSSIIQREDISTTIADLQRIDVNLSIGSDCQVFISPLGVEVIQQFLEKWINQCSYRHPASLLMDAFQKCSSRRHLQAIVANDHDERNGDTQMIPLGFIAEIPRINLNIFQCGIVEKIVPLEHLEHDNSLMPASIFVTCIENASVHIGIQNIAAADENAGRTISINSGFEKLYFHLTKIIEKGAPTIGISKNASKIGRWIAYDDLHLNSDFMPCVVLEGKVVFVDLFIRKALEHKNQDQFPVISPVAEKENVANVLSVPQESNINNDSSGHKAKNELSGLAASIALHFGLLQPLEQSGDNWPLYDLFAPSASAWLHVAYRTASSLSSALKTNDYAIRAPFCFLLTEALDCDRVFSVRKSKFEKLKLRRKRLTECPSCQTLLCLFRYTVSDEFVDFENRLQLPEELKTSKILRNATVALLSHWREALCANKLVRLNAVAATKILKSPSIEEHKAMEPDTTLLIDMDTESKPQPTDNVDHAKLGHLQLQIPKSRMESLQNLAAKFEHFAELDTKNAGQHVVNNRTKKETISHNHPSRQQRIGSGNTKSVDFKPTVTGTGAGEDLYEWMKREQENSNSRLRKKKQGRRRLSGYVDDEINPMDVPLYVYFDSLFDYLELKKPGTRSPLFDLLGHEFLIDFQLGSIVATVNEPKYLEFAGSTLKRVTHTERPLIEIHKLTLRADAKYSEELNTEVLSLPGSKEEASPPKQAVQSIDYHANVDSCNITVGFPSVTFVNQVVYVVRSVKEAYGELDVTRTTNDNKLSKEDVNKQSPLNQQAPRPSTEIAASIVKFRTSMEAGNVIDSHDKVESNVIIEIGDLQTPKELQVLTREDVPLEPESNVPVSSKESASTNQAAKRGNALLEDETDRSQVRWFIGSMNVKPIQLNQCQPWAKRMWTMLLDFQRAKKTTTRRLSPVSPNSSSEAVLVTTILGAIDCSKVEINAIFTELFAYATFNSVQLGHKSTESWTAIGPWQLRSSDKSVRGALKQINLTLSEAQSMHAVPVNVFTFSVAESNVIFRRYFLEQFATSDAMDMWRNSLGVEIGPVHVDIPLHPGSLHGLVVRGTKNISDRLPFLMTPSVVEEIVHIKKESTVGHYSRKFEQFNKVAVVHFRLNAKQFQVDAALLPSIKASYKLLDLAIFGESGSEAKFQIKIPSHGIAFDVKGVIAEAPSLIITPKIEVDFPTVDGKGAYIHHPERKEDTDILFKEGGYLQIDVEVGNVQHTLTTDLLNQLLFIQEAFTREIGEIIDKIKSEKKPPTLWSSSTSSANKKQLLYSIEVTLNTVQIMATTPTSIAVRLNTENVRFHLSNRLLRKTKEDTLERIFGVTELNITLALGQLIRVTSHQEVEPEFQQVGYFKTGVSMRNVASSSPDDIDTHISSSDGASSGNTYLITLCSPVIFAQPTAVDKALLLWLNYKNAYEFWSEQRAQIRPKASRHSSGSKRLAAHTESGGSLLEQLGTPPLLHTGSLFLQVSIENGLYICVPLYCVQHGSQHRSIDITNSALVLSLRNTGIAVCSSGSLVCRGHFTEFGLRFVEDFDGDAENWNPSFLDVDPAISRDVNACFVPEGTYDICSKTINPNDTQLRASWILNISWRMKGFDMNLNTRIWRLISLLVSTLTSLTATENEGSITVPPSRRDSLPPVERLESGVFEYSTAPEDGSVPFGADEFSYLSNMEPGRDRKRALQKLYHDLVAKIRTLEQQEADELLVEKERKKLLRLEALLFSDSRRDVVKKLRQQAQKATTSLMDQWGLNVKPTGTEEDSDKLKPRRQHYQTESSVESHQGGGRRFSELPTRQLSLRQPRTTSIDLGDSVGKIHPISEFSIQMEPDFNEDAELVNGEDFKSSKPDEENTLRRTIVPTIKFEDNSTSEKILLAGSVSSVAKAQPPPAVDLYLDLNIYVENGRCNFRTVLSKLFEQQQEMGVGLSAAMSKETQQRRQKTNSGQTGRIRLTSPQFSAPVHITTVLLPGVNVKASYASSSGTGASTAISRGHPTETETKNALEDSNFNYNLLGGKYGQLILWMSLEKMPEETVISPHILDFLEQMLEPIPVSTVSTMEQVSMGQRLPLVPEVMSASREELRATIENLGSAPDSEHAMLDASTLVTVASFPLDIVFHLNVQSSQIRFTSQPLAQIECILRLPDLQLLATSRKYSELVVPAGTSSSDAVLRRNMSSSALVKSADDEFSGGICVTVLMTGFSVSVFHMYSAGARGGAISSIVSEKRDALSIHIDTVGISLSRSRVSNDDSFSTTAISTSKFRSSVTSGTGITTTFPFGSSTKNSVKVSLLVNMGKAQFKYDMRRLHEILQFPKAWYRKTIFRRLFLGDEMPTTSRIMDTPSVASADADIDDTGDDHGRRENSAIKKKLSTSSSMSEEGTTESDEDDDVLMGFDSFRKRTTSSPSNASNRPAWDALVLFGVSFDEVSIDAMMGQVMGETKLLFAGADCQGHFALSSTKNKSVHLAFRLTKAELVARQGQVSGLISLQDLEAATYVKKSANATPQSNVTAGLQCLDIRIDWMSSPTFVGRWTQLDISLRDDWKIHEMDLAEGKPNHVEQVSVLLIGRMTWESFRILITQTTVTDLIRICYKVNEFIDQSLQSGRMALLLHTNAGLVQGDRSTVKDRMTFGENIGNQQPGTERNRPTVVKRFHRHWQKALALVTSLQLEARDFFPIPMNATILGGTVEFAGNDLALACFGHNLHSKEWLVFHLRDPAIEFSTEAKDISLDNGDLAQLIIEDLCFRLGQRQMRKISTAMGTVLCVTGAYAATHSSSIDEWLTHAFTSVLNRVYKIPSTVTYKHQYKEAFYIPSFAMHVKTKQIQTAAHMGTTSTLTPVVESSVIADFEDHVKINVQEVLYLRRFIKAYISRQSEVSTNQATTTNANARSIDRNDDPSKQVTDPTQELQKDAREYKINNWHVEPTIRLMSLESMETTDYLWQILGIYQYAVTVSKWLQRGFLDPLDSILASLMEQILLAEKKSKQK